DGAVEELSDARGRSARDRHARTRQVPPLERARLREPFDLEAVPARRADRQPAKRAGAEVELELPPQLGFAAPEVVPERRDLRPEVDSHPGRLARVMVQTLLAELRGEAVVHQLQHRGGEAPPERGARQLLAQD